MSEATGPILLNDAADTEMELSAADLLALSSPPAKSDALLTWAQSISTVSVRTRAAGAPKLPINRHPVVARIAFSLVGAVVLVSAGYGLITWYKEAPSLAYTFEQKTSLRELLSDASSQAEAEPVRFANPFDAKEVFEFSPGTSQDAAREAVAEILLKRAMARQGS